MIFPVGLVQLRYGMCARLVVRDLRTRQIRSGRVKQSVRTVDRNIRF